MKSNQTIIYFRNNFNSIVCTLQYFLRFT